MKVQPDIWAALAHDLPQNWHQPLQLTVRLIVVPRENLNPVLGLPLEVGCHVINYYESLERASYLREIFDQVKLISECVLDVGHVLSVQAVGDQPTARVKPIENLICVLLLCRCENNDLEELGH